MGSTGIQFWYDFASTYSYLAASRVDQVATERSIEVEWKVFLLGPIFAEQGWNDSPFNIYPAKGRYMWRDLERRCEAAGVSLVRPSQFPRNGLLAARVALLAEPEGSATDVLLIASIPVRCDVVMRCDVMCFVCKHCGELRFVFQTREQPRMNIYLSVSK